MDEISLGLLILRAVVGALFAGHGLGNLFGWLGSFGLDGTGEILERFGFRPGRFWAGFTGIVEVLSGIMLVLGFLTPLAVASVVGVMTVAMRTSHAGKGPWYFNGGWEYNLTLVAAAVTVGTAGPGELSLDWLLGLDTSGLWGLAALAAGVLTATLALGMRPRKVQTS